MKIKFLVMMLILSLLPIQVYARQNQEGTPEPEAGSKPGTFAMILLNNHDDTMVRVSLNEEAKSLIFPVADSVWTSKTFSRDGKWMSLSRSGNIITYSFEREETYSLDVEHTQIGHLSPDGSQLSVLFRDEDAGENSWEVKVISPTGGHATDTLTADDMPAEYASLVPTLEGFFLPDRVFMTMREPGKKRTPNSPCVVWNMTEHDIFPASVGYGVKMLDILIGEFDNELLFRLIEDDRQTLNYGITDDVFLTVFEAAVIEEAHFIDSGRSFAVLAQTTAQQNADESPIWVQVFADGTTKAMPLTENDDYVINAPGGYVFLRSDSYHTRAIYLRAGSVEEKVLWDFESDTRIDWQSVWFQSSPGDAD